MRNEVFSILTNEARPLLGKRRGWVMSIKRRDVKLPRGRYSVEVVIRWEDDMTESTFWMSGNRVIEVMVMHAQEKDVQWLVP